jgi:glycosyltransferase involved in cell wall biosynthesis
LRIVFVGDAHSETFRRSIEGEIARLGLAETIRSVGYCDDMPAAYLAAAVTVAPAIEPEAFGRVAVEAQAMGAPVIVSDLGAAAETILAWPQYPPHESTGWRIPPGDPDALARTIQIALGMTASQRDALSMRGRANASRRFSVDKMCDGTLGVYERLLDV